ncbi:MAG: hypothetical protein V3U86_07210, partial [Acidobacteriota bacterium]
AMAYRLVASAHPQRRDNHLQDTLTMSDSLIGLLGLVAFVVVLALAGRSRSTPKLRAPEAPHPAAQPEGRRSRR